jgi:probable HAF family extracellular repeat protein
MGASVRGRIGVALAGAAAILALAGPACAKYHVTLFTDPTADSLGSATYVAGINNAGDIIGDYSDSTGFFFTSFKLSGGVFTDISVPGSIGLGTQVGGISDAGEIVGSFEDGSGFHGFKLSGGTYTPYDVPSAYSTGLSGINSSGRVIGAYTTHAFPAPVIAFTESGGVDTTLAVPGTNRTQANGINDAGDIVGFSVPPLPGRPTDGFLYSGGTYTPLDDPLAFPHTTVATGINNNGQVVGYYEDGAGAFVWQGGVFTPVRFNKFKFPVGDQILPEGINDAGEIAGRLYDAGGSLYGFLATPYVPEPQTWSLMLLGVGAIGLAARRRRMARVAGAA